MPAPENFHAIPNPSRTISDRNRLETGAVDEKALARRWRPRAGSLLEVMLSTISRVSLRLIDRTDGNAYSADELRTSFLGSATAAITAPIITAALQGEEGDPTRIGAEYLPDAITWAGNNPNIPEVLTITGITDPSGHSTVTIPRVADEGGFAKWLSETGIFWTMQRNGGNWYLLDGDSTYYDAQKTSSAVSPVGLTGWTISNGAGQPTITGDNPTGAFSGQWCKASTAWWQWSGTSWIPRFTLAGDPICYNATLSAYRKLVVSGSDGAEVITISTL